MNTSTKRPGDFAALHATANLSKLAAEEMSDGELIERIAAADDVAMQVLYRRHYGTIFRLIYRIVGTRQAAEDLTSDVFLAVWHKANMFERRCEVSTWLFAIGRHKALEARRQRINEPLDEEAIKLIEDESAGPELTIEKQDTNSILRKCLEQLSPAHRVVIELVYFHDKTTTDAARITGIERSTVKTRLFYARKHLTELLGAQGIVTASA
jgi:RNA polymerase sigma-70 factor (ECF subfamily)